jgi:hypothetical protein
MSSSKGIFFIIGRGRSGTTAITRALDTADNGSIFIESDPKLCIAARSQYYGMLPHPKDFIFKSLIKNIEAAHKENRVYGDKNPNYLYFIEELYDVFDCKFLFVLRDGRDSVRSSMDFDRYRTPLYRRYEDSDEFDLTQPEDDFWDYARLRPRPGEGCFDEWMALSKFEKFCWSWANFNKLLLEKSKKIPEDCFRFVNMTGVDVGDIEELFKFLDLAPFKEEMVREILFSKVNTTEIRNGEPFPDWKSWSREEIETFNKHAGEMMIKLGYQQ